MSTDDINQQGAEEEEYDDVVVLVDAEGNEVTFGIIGFVEDEDTNEGMFALLSPLDQLEAEVPEGEEAAVEVFIFHYQENDDGSEDFAAVEDEALFQRVCVLAEPLLAGDGDVEIDES